MQEQNLTMSQALNPEEVQEEMRQALHRRAIGYEVEEMYQSEGPEGSRTIVRTKHIPGDPKAMLEYMRLFGTDTGGWS